MTFPGNTSLTLAWIGTACWGVCFWWMHRLSSRQDATMKEIHEMTRRIEALSKAEHDLIKEVHPTVEKIREDVAGVASAVTDNAATKSIE